MFEQYAAALWIALFVALVLYSLWRHLGAPYMVRRFYTQISLLHDSGTDLEQSPYEASLLLSKLHSGKAYAGTYKGQRVEQFAASPRVHKPSIFNRAQRRRHHNSWTVTLIHSNSPVVAFCARPVKSRDAMEYLLNTNNVIFPDDELFANMVHVLADDHQQLIAAFTPLVREHLNGIDPVSLESVNTLLILKSPRQPHDSVRKLQLELDTLIDIHRALGTVR